MSGYDKSHEAYLYEYAATRPSQEQSYAAFTQPTFTSHYPAAQAGGSHAQPGPGQMPFLYGSRDVGYQQPEYFTSAASRNHPEVRYHSPPRGLPGGKISIYIRSSYDLFAQPTTDIAVMFGHKRCHGGLTKIGDEGQRFDYVVSAEIPSFDETGFTESQVPLMLSMVDEYGQDLGYVKFGDFTYADSTAFHSRVSPQLSRKRKLSDTAEYIQPSPKKIASQPTRASGREAPQMLPHTPNSLASTSPYLQSTVPSSYGYSAGYERAQQQQAQSYTRAAAVAQRPSYSQLASAQPILSTQSSRLPSYSPYTQASQPAHSPPSITATPATRTAVMPSPSSTGTPQLVRTSTIQTGANSASPVPGPSPAFNPYAIYPNSKAQLKIDGDLDSMVEDWTPEEFEAKRRLVVFKRSQKGGTVTTSASPVKPENRVPQSITISCIYWEERQEFFVTSVDTIFLLESLVGVRFTVEEKNRIRRNLEGFRPQTVSKARADSEEFFKTIMGFPNPKPRNIEKDVKVFPWKILSHALKKIISKYSASYSSTASALLPPTASAYASAGPSETIRTTTVSPRSATSSAAPTSAYGQSMTTTAASPDLRLSAGPVASMTSELHNTGAQPISELQSPAVPLWQTSSPFSMAHYPGTLAAPSTRPSYDLLYPFNESSQLTAVPGSTQSMAAHHGGIVSAAEDTSGAEGYPGYGHRTSR